MALQYLKRVQILPLSLEEAWEFFSSPYNLEKITPPDMKFRVIPPEPEPSMRPGMIIQYKVRPFPMVPLRWITEITHVERPFLFVDEQRFGPYRFWHHSHLFRQTEEGLEMTDLVYYLIPPVPFSSLLDRWIVRPRLDRIFRFREKALKELFPG